MSIDPTFRSAVLAALPAGAPTPDNAQLDLMYGWYKAVVETNRQFNLTRITDPAEAAVKHFADSLAVLAWCENGVRSPSHASRWVNPGGHRAAIGSSPPNGGGDKPRRSPDAPDPISRDARVLDVGTGAGFPAAPLAIMRPDWQVTAIDSTGKKARFVCETASRLGLSNLAALQARAGQWKPTLTFDLVLFKAVGAMGECLAEARHLVRKGGYVVHFKTADVSEDEEVESRRAASKLGFEPLPSYPYMPLLGEESLKRVLWIFRK